MRKITSHKVNGCNDGIEIKVLDEPGCGGACHNYGIAFVAGRPDDHDDSRETKQTLIQFQNGPIKEVGINGITHEALLAILIDRLEGFQSGQYACDDNQEALDALRKAQSVLQRRTLARVARGVEGTHTV